MKSVILSALFFVFLTGHAYAQATIGLDSTFAIQPIVFLTAATPEAGVFNYFFTLEIFAGMVALFIRICMKVLRL